jgi:hypothetical protein
MVGKNPNDPIEVKISDDDKSSYLDAIHSISSQSQEELEYHLSWGATPLAGAEHPDVRYLQDRVVQPLLLHRVETSAPEDTPPLIRSFMEHSFLMRFAGRASKNYDSYAERLVQDIPDDADPEIALYEQRALRGTASPEELIIVRRTLGMRAIELARLTHPYGVMYDQLDAMRDDVAKAITNQGGVVFEPKDYNEKYKLRATGLLLDPNNREQVMSLLITRRRDFGMVDDDTLDMERTSFIIPVHAGSAYDPVLSKRMRKISMVNNPNRIQELEEAGRISEVVPEILEAKDFKAAIPQSTTNFEFNRITDAQIEQRKAVIASQNQREFAQRYPELEKARLEHLRKDS